MSAQLWSDFALSAWVQSFTVMADTTGEGDTLASVRWVALGSASHCGGGHDRRGRYSGL